jgi:hypothetical protein
MKLTIVNILNRGVQKDERLHLKATADANLNFFMVLATAYSSPTAIVTTPKHVFWFPSKPIKAGDTIILYSRPGVATETKNTDGTTSHFFFWGKGSAIWVKTGDCAVVLELNSWKTSPYQ